MKKVLIGLAVLIVLVAGAGLAMPTSYAIEKSVVINAKPEAIHAHLDDLKKWEAWAPWYKMDDSIEVTYGEQTTGVGANQTWTSADSPGELTLTRSDPATGIAYEMAFIMEDDSKAPADCAMNFTVNGGTTTVTWTMTGDVGDMMRPVLSGLMTPVVKSSIGDMFEDGLQDLKTVVEGK